MLCSEGCLEWACLVSVHWMPDPFFQVLWWSQALQALPSSPVVREKAISASRVLKGLSPPPFVGFPPSSWPHPHSLNKSNHKRLFSTTCSLPRLSVFALSGSAYRTTISSPSLGLNSYPTCKADHKCLFGQKSFTIIPPSPEPPQHSLWVCAGMLSHFSHAQLCATLWTAAHQPPVHGILQARILERVRPALIPLPPVTLISAHVFFT